MLSKCKCEAGLLCAALTEHWHYTERLSWWVGTAESAGSGRMSSTPADPQSSLALNSSSRRTEVLAWRAGLKGEMAVIKNRKTNILLML